MRLVLKWDRFELDLSRRTHVMGVLNVTPDSFSDGGRFFETEKAVAQALQMERDGADIIDLGGESTRPFSKEISVEAEIERVIPVLQGVKGKLKAPVSIDTRKAAVAEAALEAGAAMINDISALQHDPKMAPLAARWGVPIIVMHMKGTPEIMQQSPHYEDLIPEIIQFLQQAVKRATSAGVEERLIMVDPGIGFGKGFDDNLQIIKQLHRLEVLEKPILVGSSNKGFIGEILQKGVSERNTGTMATVSAAVMNGAHVVRVHDVAKAVETVKIIDAIKRGTITP